MHRSDWWRWTIVAVFLTAFALLQILGHKMREQDRQMRTWAERYEAATVESSFAVNPSINIVVITLPDGRTDTFVRDR